MARSNRPAGPPRPPRAHWVLFGLLLLVLGSGLVFDGYTRRALGRSGTGSATPAAAPGFAKAGPVIDLRGPTVRSASGTAGTIALTFDDGPDRRWTPKILAILQHYHVPATFFVVGSRVLTDPGLVRRELDEGDEVGSHTFVHADVATLPGWQRHLELSLTQLALAYAGQVHTGLFRPPYSSEPDAVLASDEPSWRDVAGQGYLIVLANRDSRDWTRPGVPRILANAAPSQGAASGTGSPTGTATGSGAGTTGSGTTAGSGSGAGTTGSGTIVLFHDGGGNRSQTVAALQQFIPIMLAKGYRFTTVTSLLGLSPTAGDAPVGPSDQLQGWIIAQVARLGFFTVAVLSALAWPLAVLIVARCLLLLAFARRHRRGEGQRPVPAGDAPPVSIVVPAYNEAAVIANCVRSLAASEYPQLEVVVVDDGSTEGTAAIVAGLGLAKVRLVRQANAGKAAALNTGLSVARFDIVVMVDGDTAFEPQTLARLVRPLADPAVGAVSGNTKVVNRKGLLGRWQHIEYVMGFNLDRRMYDVLDCMPTVPGAIGAFRRDVLTQVGGVSTDTLAEDTDLTMAVVRAGWRVAYAGDAVAWTEAPASLSQLWKQRYRWCYGTLQSMWKHRRALREPGPLGRRAMPYLLVFQVLLPLLAPVIDLYTIFGLVFVHSQAVLAYWVGINVLGLLMAWFALRLDGESLRPLWAVLVQQLVYRQLMYLVVIQSAVTAVLGSQLHWHKLARHGILDSTPVTGR